eukprot:jgi/Psemu1/1861/gm1.1861_g
MALELALLGYYYYYDNYLTPDYNSPLLGEKYKRRRDPCRSRPRIAIKRYSQSAFMYLYRSGNDQALLNCCGVDHVVLRKLLHLFEPLYNLHTVDKNTGVIRKKIQKPQCFAATNQFNTTGCLALVLFWFRTRGSATRAVALAFGLTFSPMYRWLKFGRRLLLFALQEHPAAKVCLVNQEETQQYIDEISAKYPVLAPHRVWGACGGLKLHLQQSGNWMKHNQYYNGWTCGAYLKSVLIFAPDGRIRACILNAPGLELDYRIESLK